VVVDDARWPACCQTASWRRSVDGDHQGVGQQAHDLASFTQPTSRRAAQGLEVQAQQRLVL
jgi:hypothetical protein